MECPVWARRGCFKTVSEHYEDNYKRVTETIRLVFQYRSCKTRVYFRGCSTFDWADPAIGGFDHEASCNGARLDDDQYEGECISDLIDINIFLSLQADLQ